MTNPSPQEWVQELTNILRKDYMPVIMDEIRGQVGPMVRGMVEELRPTLEEIVRNEIKIQFGQAVLAKVKVEIVNCPLRETD